MVEREDGFSLWLEASKAAFVLPHAIKRPSHQPIASSAHPELIKAKPIEIKHNQTKLAIATSGS